MFMRSKNLLSKGAVSFLIFQSKVLAETQNKDSKPLEIKIGPIVAIASLLTVATCLGVGYLWNRIPQPIMLDPNNALDAEFREIRANDPVNYTP